METKENRTERFPICDDAIDPLPNKSNKAKSLQPGIGDFKRVNTKLRVTVSTLTNALNALKTERPRNVQRY